MFTKLLYALTVLALILSCLKNKTKTEQAIRKGIKSFENILPIFLALILLIGIILSILTPQTISELLGANSGLHGIVLAGVVGSCSVIPGFVTFPLAKTLMENGAGVLQVIIFISTSVMVGVITLPLEIAYFGKKASYVRNGLAVIFSFLIAFTMEWILR
jgi:uncharacterized membrane protein YraQ (UPF0718 family)